MARFVRDPTHWLRRFSPDEWIQLALAEVRRAEAAYARGDGKGGLAGCRRAAGMALNAALVVSPDESWGRSYVDHVRALAADASAPEAVRKAARLLLDAQPPGAPLVTLRAPRGDAKIVEATRDVMAHGYALVARAGPLEKEEPS